MFAFSSLHDDVVCVFYFLFYVYS